jgi:hypothetical protein
MFFSSNSSDDAERAIDDIRGLIDQQMYQFQGLIADLQVTAIAMQNIVAMRKVTDEIAGELQAGATNLKHDLRNARGELENAVGRLEELQNMLTELDLDE